MKPPVPLLSWRASSTQTIDTITTFHQVDIDTLFDYSLNDLHGRKPGLSQVLFSDEARSGFLPPQTGSRGRWSCCSSHRASPPLPSLSVCLWTPTCPALCPYPDGKGGNEVSQLWGLRSTLECKTWKIKTDELWIDMGLHVMSYLSFVMNQCLFIRRHRLRVFT